MGNAYPAPGPLLASSSTTIWSRSSRSCATRSAGTTPSALACTAKYYEDMGYFGHVNCSDNFNGQLEPYTIAPRKGWPAINFFFNTAFDAHNQLRRRRAVVATGRLRAAARD